MDVSKKPDARIEFTPEFWRSLVRKIVAEEETLSDLVREMGIPRDVLRKWALLETKAAHSYEPLVPARRVDELERQIEELKTEVEGLRSKVQGQARGPSLRSPEH